MIELFSLPVLQWSSKIHHRWPAPLTKNKTKTLWCYLFFLWSTCAILNYESGKRGFLPATINRQIPLSRHEAQIWDGSLTDGVSPSSAWRPVCMRVRARACVEVCTFCMIFIVLERRSVRSKVRYASVYVPRTCLCVWDRREGEARSERTWIHAHRETCWRVSDTLSYSHPKSLWCLLCYSTLWLLHWFN